MSPKSRKRNRRRKQSSGTRRKMPPVQRRRFVEQQVRVLGILYIVIGGLGVVAADLKSHLSIPASLHLSPRFPHGCTDFRELSHHFQRSRPSPPLLALANCPQSRP